MSSSQIQIKYNITENEYNKELQEIMKNLNVYNNEISEIFRKSAKAKAKAKASVGNIVIKYGNKQDSPFLNFKGCKVMKKEYIDFDDDNIFVIALLILDNNNDLLLTKELKILKTIDIDEIKSKFLEKINNTSLIIKIKDLLSKINELNDISYNNSMEFEQKFNKLNKSEIDDLKIQYKEQYNILKQEYTNLVSGLYAYEKLGKNLLNDYNKEYNLLRQLDTYIEQELNNSIDEDYIKFQNEHNTPHKTDMFANGREESYKINSYNYFQKKKNLKNYYDNTESILDTKKYEVVITKYKEYKNEITCSEPTKVQKKEYKQEIILKNIGKYDKNFIKEEEIYNKDEENIEILLISRDMKSSEPGLIPPEKINESSLEENKFQILKTYSDWRKKLCADYIFEIIDSRGTYILPILIDNNYFASFSHFYYFSKFKNRIDKEGALKEQYNRFADSLVLSGLNSRRYGEKNGYKSLEEIQSKINSLGLTYSDTEDESNIVLKGLFAKFYQNDELQDILKNTIDSMLIINTNDINTYKIDYNLMIIRYLLNNLENNKDNILKFYPNYSSDGIKINKLKLKCEKERELDNNKLFYSTPFSRIKFDSYSIYDYETSYTMTPDEIENKSTSLDKKTSISKPTTSVNKPVSKPTDEDKLVDKDKSTDIFNSFNENLSILEKTLDSQGLEIIHQPDTGDCLFFSINEGIIKNKIPNYENLNKGELKTYIVDPRKSEDKRFRYNFKTLKTEIINKLKANFYQNGVSGEQRNEFKKGEEQLEIIISSVIGPNDCKSIDDYFKKFSKDGYWGDQNVIYGVSALYNINIIVYSIFGEPIETLAIDSRKQLPYGEEKNSQHKNLPALMLGFIPVPGHYVLLKKKDETQKGGNNNLEDLEDKLWEKRKYFIIEIENDNKLYNVASLVTKNYDKDIRIEPEALYNSENGLLIYNDSPLWNKLVDKTNNYFLKNNKNYKKNSDILVKYYFINAINNDVHDPKNNMKNIGKLKLTKENKNSLSKIVYNN